MSNKMLITVIALVILAGAGVGGFLYWQQTKPLVVPLNTTDNQAPASNDQAKDLPTGVTPHVGTSTPENSDICVRNFDAKKLASNASLNIHNRQAAIDVKGFGTIQLEFYDKDAPKTVANFLRLTDSGYYNCLTFHRVAKGFVVQAGDPNGNGTGGTSAYGAPFADELNPLTPSYKAGYVKGVLAMANSGPNTNGSQFFIMLADNSLPHSYTIFGKVSSGQDVVDKIGQVEITPQMGPTDGAPKVPVVMQSVKIIK